ncbi:hypothetical protein BD779DRAFT_307044 [Infundibulicybe gibba]|nr:hypothetical protein BD779DRAFT_307044 [Infundibulicybe gibba]
MLFLDACKCKCRSLGRGQPAMSRTMGVKSFSPITVIPTAVTSAAQIVEIETRLAKTRTYAKPPHNAWCPGFRDARSDKYAQLFQKIYVEAEDPPFSVKHDREFLAFFNILECYQTDSDRISSDGSSSMKASHLIVNFIVPPFFSCGFEGLEYKEQESLGFPIFLARMDQPDMWCKYVPISDFMVAATSSICPLITSEVISQRVSRINNGCCFKPLPLPGPGSI